MYMWTKLLISVVCMLFAKMLLDMASVLMVFGNWYH